MEAKLLNAVHQTDTHVRIEASEQLLAYFKSEEASPQDFPDLEHLIAGLAAWLSSSNSKISMGAVAVLTVLVERMSGAFKQYIPAVLPSLRERLGDSKEAVRDKVQLFLQLVMQHCFSSPQVFLDRLLEPALAHRNWRVKEQAMVCLVRTLDYFGSGQVTVSKFIGSLCSLLGDANSQVRSCALDTLVQIYHHVGVKVRIDLSRRGLPAAKMALLSSKFDEIDQKTNAVPDLEAEVDGDSVSSCSSNISSTSARTHNSTRSISSTRSRGNARPPRPGGGVAGGPSAAGSVISEADFEKAFTDVPAIHLFTSHDLDRVVSRVADVLNNTSNNWEMRVHALKEVRSVVGLESLEASSFLPLLRKWEDPLNTSLRDLRSQVTREACVSISFLATTFGSDCGHFAESVFVQLMSLVPNSAKIMAVSAEICIKYVLRHVPNPRLLQHLFTGLQSKSPIIRRCGAEHLALVLHCWEVPALEKASQQIEEVIRRSIADADSQARRHMRRAFWGYQRVSRMSASRMMEGFDPQLQRLLEEEKHALDREAKDTSTSAALNAYKRPKRDVPPLNCQPPHTTAPETTHSSISLPPPPSSKAHTFTNPTLSLHSSTPHSRPLHAHAVPSASLPDPSASLPAIKLQRPSSRKALPHTPHALNHGSPPSPRSLKYHRPPSRGSVARPPSRGTTRTNELRAKGLPRVSRSAQPSPSLSRESSPGRSGRNSASLTRHYGSLTAESVMKLYGGGGRGEDEEDTASVTSERSSYSITSEVSVCPFVKYPNPITDVGQLVAMCSSQQWPERKDGISQLQLLLDNSHPLSHADIQSIKLVFRRMFTEPNIKVYAVFLDAFSKFLEDHVEYLEDWLFLLLLRLLHRQGADLLSSLHYKVQLVLDLVRKSFEPEQQFSTLCRILTDQTQPMGNKVRLAWLEYLQDLVPLLDSADFKDSMETRQAFTKLLGLVSEPKSLEVRRSSQKAVIALFGLNPTTFTMLQRSLTREHLEASHRIIKGHLQNEGSSGDDMEQRVASPPPPPPVFSSGMVMRTPPTSIHRRTTPKKRPPLAPPSPSPSSSLRASRNTGLCTSSPDVRTPGKDLHTRYSSSKARPPPSGLRGRAATPSRIPRPTSVTPGAARHSMGRCPIAPRAQSVDPEKMAERGRGPGRPSSARSDYNALQYQGGPGGEVGGEEGGDKSSSSTFSFSDLSKLNFSSPDDAGTEVTEVLERDEVALILRELEATSNPKMKVLALQSLFTMCREFPDKCHWQSNFQSALTQLLAVMDDEENQVKFLAVRVLRELLKIHQQSVADSPQAEPPADTAAGEVKRLEQAQAEMVTGKVLSAFADKDTSISQAAEDTFDVLVPLLPSHQAVDFLAALLSEKYPMLLGVVKLLTKVLNLSDRNYVQEKLGVLVPGVIKGYCHSESNVRKASVYCLVSLQSKAGGCIKPHLARLTSSQMKLYNLYIKRHEQAHGNR